MERKLHLFTDGGGGGGISDKLSNQLELYLYYINVRIYLIIGSSPRPGVLSGTEHKFESMKAIMSNSAQHHSMETCKATFLRLDILCAGDGAYFINN